MNTAILLQPIQLIINIMFIPIFITYSDAEVLKDPTSAWYGDSGHEFILAIVILVLGVVNIFICFTNPRCKRQKTTLTIVGDQERELSIKFRERFDIILRRRLNVKALVSA